MKSQAQDSAGKLLRVYEDDDFINIVGQGTDESYTNGTRIDLFYFKKHRSRFFVDKAMPKAGKGSIDIYGWGLMQTMITPSDISQSQYQPHDYPYSGALFATHTLYSYNPVKKYDFQTELVLGVMGPPALARQTQTFVHSIENYQKPMGWDNQIGTDILVNINFTAEKQLAAYDGFIELITGAQVFGGTMLNGISVYPLIIRFGKMNPYFNGFMSQYSNDKKYSKWQLYGVIRPHADLIFTNALLEGGLFSSKSYPPKDDSYNKPDEFVRHLRHTVGEIDAGFVVAYKHISGSFMQKISTPMVRGLYGHTVGNISLYYSW